MPKRRPRLGMDRWECAVGGGFLVPHREAIRALVEGHARMRTSTGPPKRAGCGDGREDARWVLPSAWQHGSPRFLGTNTALGTADLHAMANPSGRRPRLDQKTRRVRSAPINAIQIGLHRPASTNGSSMASTSDCKRWTTEQRILHAAPWGPHCLTSNVRDLRQTDTPPSSPSCPSRCPVCGSMSQPTTSTRPLGAGNRHEAGHWRFGSGPGSVAS